MNGQKFSGYGRHRLAQEPRGGSSAGRRSRGPALQPEAGEKAGSGDLATGERLEAAVQGVEAIVHCASSPAKTCQVDVEGTERLLGVADRAGISHVLFISIVGIDRNPCFHTAG